MVRARVPAGLVMNDLMGRLLGMGAEAVALRMCIKDLQVLWRYRKSHQYGRSFRIPAQCNCTGIQAYLDRLKDTDAIQKLPAHVVWLEHIIAYLEAIFNCQSCGLAQVTFFE